MSWYSLVGETTPFVAEAEGRRADLATVILSWSGFLAEKI